MVRFYKINTNTGVIKEPATQIKNINAHARVAILAPSLTPVSISTKILFMLREDICAVNAENVSSVPMLYAFMPELILEKSRTLAHIATKSRWVLIFNGFLISFFFRFADMSTRTDHLVRKHKDLEGRSIFCDICQKPFRTIAAKERHQERKSCTKSGMKTALLVCKYEDCNYSTRYHNSLRYHVKSIHEKLKSFKCKFCSKAFTSKHQALRHEETHDKNRERHPCNECNKTFLRIGALERHRKQLHLNNTPHKCLECGSGFVYPSQLKQHMYKHKGIKPYKCRFCSSFFQHVATAWSHEHRVHKEEWKKVGHTLGPLKPVEDDKAEVIQLNTISQEAIATVPIQLNQPLMEGVTISNMYV